MRSQTQHSLVLQQLPLSFSNETVVCDIATGKPCLFVPHTLRRAVFTALHSLAHLGIQASQQLLVSCFMWPRINKNVWQWTWQCLQCQYTKVHCHMIPNTYLFHPILLGFICLKLRTLGTGGGTSEGVRTAILATAPFFLGRERGYNRL